MNKIITITLSLITFITFSQDVKLKVTYNGQGVSGHTVSAYIQGQKRGSGVTNSNGEATIHIQGLNSLYLDWKGEKTCDNGQKKWEVNGFGKLDDNNSFHLKMEEITKMMAKESGGFISEGMIATSYGLVCGTNSNQNKNTNSSSTPKQEKEQSQNSQVIDDFMSGKTREEGLQNQKASLINSIHSIENKISNKKNKISKGKVTGKDAEIEELEIEDLNLKKQIKQNRLEKINLQLQNKTLNKTEKTTFKNRENDLEEKRNFVQSKIKEKKNAPSPNTPEKTEKVDKEDHLLTVEDISKMSSKDLKLRRAKINPVIGANKVKLKLRSKKMTAAEKTNLQNRNTKLSMILDLINNELDKREE